MAAYNIKKKDLKVFNENESTENLSNSLYIDINSRQWPIIYCDKYNINFLGLQKMHPFDSEKWGKVSNKLRGLNFSP